MKIQFFIAICNICSMIDSASSFEEKSVDIFDDPQNLTNQKNEKKSEFDDNLCPASGLSPCNCANSVIVAGTIDIFCPSEVNSQEFLVSILKNATFVTTEVNQFSLNGSSISGIIDYDLFKPLQIRILRLDDDSFSLVDNGAFLSSKNSLLLLRIESNLLQDLFDLQSLTELIEVDLKGNSISLLRSESLNSHSINSLDLSHNKITYIGVNAFAGMTELIKLDLSYNHLGILQDNSFSFKNHRTDAYTEILLQNNNITKIEDDAFFGLTQISLDLRNNSLITLEEHVFEPLIIFANYGAIIKVQGNPIICDCEIWWAAEDVNMKVCFDDFQCSNLDESFYGLASNQEFLSEYHCDHD